MAFDNIKELPTAVAPGTYYFLDANVWIYAATNSLLPNSKDKGNSAYTKFFHQIVNSPVSGGPRIILCSFLLSEIVNTYLKKFAMADYINIEFTQKQIQAPKNLDYKIQYRRTEHFKTHFRLILDEIRNYNSIIEVVDDGFKEMQPFQFKKSCPNFMDLNDYMYYSLTKFLKKKYSSLIFVTNDTDFKVEDIEIYTRSAGLLNLKK